MASRSTSGSGAVIAEQSCVHPGAPGPDLDLLLTWPDAGRASRWRFSFLVSIGIHIVLFALGLRFERLIARQAAPRQTIARRVTPLYIPPDLLTQRTAHRGENSKTFDLADLTQTRQAQKQVTAPPPGSVRRLRLPKSDQPAKKQAPAILPEPPKEVAANPAPPAGSSDTPLAPAPSPPAPAELTLPAAGIAAPEAKAAPKLAPPKNSVQDVIHQIAQGGAESPQLTVTDSGANKSVPSSPGQQPGEGHLGSEIKLQTDPQGADFRPYLAMILSIVRRNWFSVLPHSARFGALHGRTTIQFVVNRNGEIPKLVIADSSGLQPLDNAAVAGLSMSNPLPPLPAEFKGAFIRLQFSFACNVPSL